MAHYDSAYEEFAEETRRREELYQSRCEHPDWVLVYCTQDGKPKVTQCRLCGKTNHIESQGEI